VAPFLSESPIRARRQIVDEFADRFTEASEIAMKMCGRAPASPAQPSMFRESCREAISATTRSLSARSSRSPSTNSETARTAS